jgi:serine/threonine protein kinase
VTTHKIICIQDNKKRGAVFDMDPSAHYEIDRSELEPMEHIPPLSKGPDAEIRVVKWRGTKVAAKTIYLPLTEDPEVFNKLKLQLLMLEQMRHPNIVQFLCAVTRSRPIVIVTEYLPGVNLFFSPVWMEQQVGEISVIVLLAVDF